MTTSTATFEKLKNSIPGGVNSPVRSFQGLGVPPIVVDRAEGDTLIDMDGNRYIDYCMSWGPLIHGHAHPEILNAVHKRLDRGTSFGMCSDIEEKAASKVKELMPSIEKIRFVSSGTEATMTAVRVARGYTGREIIVKFSGHYHGHADAFLVQAGSSVAHLPGSSSSGVPQQKTACLPFNDCEAVRELLRSTEVAAVILEPVAGNMGVVPATQEFINVLREETEKTGALLIFDEVMTGFRVSLNGAQSLYDVKPDLTCLGKIVGGGFPAAAFGGKKEIMDCLAPLGPVYQAGTLSGNPIAMEAGYQSLKLLEKPGFYEELERKSNIITEPLKKAGYCVQQVGSMFTLFLGVDQVRNYEEAQKLDKAAFAKLFQHMFKNGIFLPPSPFEAWFPSSAHTDEHLQQTSDILMEGLKPAKRS